MRRFAQSGQPRVCLVLAGFFRRHDRISEALDLCEKAGDSIPHEVIAEAIVSVVYSGRIDESECDGRGAMARSLAKAPGNAGLFHLGNVRSLQGRYREAEAFYRESHARDANNSGPLANLAWRIRARDRKGAEALDIVAQAIALDGPTPDLLDTRGIAYLAMGRSDLAIKELEDASTSSPTAIRYVHLGQAYRLPACRSRQGPGKGEGSGAENGKPLTPRNGCLSRIA